MTGNARLGHSANQHAKELGQELGELLCQGAIPRGEYKIQGKKQPRPDKVTELVNTRVAQVWGWARLGQFITPTDTSENQDGVQGGLGLAIPP